MKVNKISDEVLYTADSIVRVSSKDIAELTSLAERNSRKRVRLCAHPDSANRLHEMLIVLGDGTYIRPHRHPGKSESFHVISGCVDILLFDDTGKPLEYIELGDYSSGKCFYFRIEQQIFHTVILRSDHVVIHETTNGPFNRADTEFASWAPEEDRINDGNQFLIDTFQQLRG